MLKVFCHIRFDILDSESANLGFVLVESLEGLDKAS